MLRLLLPVLVLFGVVALSVLSDRPQPPADFVFINRGDVTTLDLQRMSWMQDLRVAQLLFEGLVRHDVFTTGYEIRPAMAERWEVSPDGLEYTFHLREDARWSNGQPLTAGDFVYSWRRALLPDTASDYTNLFQNIAGSIAFYDWRVNALEAFRNGDDAMALWRETERRFSEMVGLRALDDRTLWIKLEQPTPYFLDLCAFGVFYPVYPPLVRQYETINHRTGRLEAQHGWTKPPHLVTNGPFKLTLWRFKRDMRMEKNEHYWNKDAIAIDTIVSPSINDGNAAVLAFKTGAVDWVSDVTPPYKADILAEKLAFYAEHKEEVERLRAMGLDQFEIDRRLPPDSRKNIHAIPAFGTYWWNFICTPRLSDGRPNPFADARVRRAFAMVIDKRAIVDDVRRIGEPVARTIIPPDSIGGYRAPAGLPCISDFATSQERAEWVAKARALLAEAGWPDPTQFPTVELLFNKDGGHDLIAQAIGRNWEEHLGVSVTMAQKEVKVFRDDLKEGRFMTSRSGWYGDYGDPTTFLDLSRTGDGNNDRKYSNPHYDSLLDRAKAEMDPVARMEILHECERIIMDEDVPMVPIFHYVTLYLFDANKFTGLNPHPRSDQHLHHIDMFGDGKGSDEPKVMKRTPTGVPQG